MTLLEHIHVTRRHPIFADENRIKAAMELLVEKEDPSFKIAMILIGLAIFYVLGLSLSYA